MLVVRTRADLAAALTRLRREGGSVGLVPTMGSLHEGHLSLLDQARGLAGATAVSIFVNPLQFAPAEDLAHYPRDEGRDLGLLEARGADLVFAPDDASMYPGGEPSVTVAPGPMERRLCGPHRPGHFRGVMTVVAKLFGLLRPDVSVFGRKDFQQAVLIRRMVQDLELGVRIETGAIVREPDGLAMSSRNAYLRPEERAQAPALYAALTAAGRRFAEGERRARPLLETVRREVVRHSLLELQYVDIVHPETLDSVDPVPEASVLALAAFCGTTRLIDNVELGRTA